MVKESKPNPTAVKGWKIDLRNYQVQVATDRKGVAVFDDYDVKDSLVRMLWNPALELTVEQAFETKPLVDRIRATKDGIVIDQSDYVRLKKALAVIRGAQEDDLELFRRIRDAKEVELTIKGT